MLLNTARGRVKDRNLRRDPRLSVMVEEGYRYVVIRGTARLVDDQATAQAAIRLLATRHNGAAVAERQMQEQVSREHRVSISLPLAGTAADSF